MAKVSVITFDKTGTLSYGLPQVTVVKSFSDLREAEIFTYTAAAEQLSEHLLGKAVVRCYKQNVKTEISSCKAFRMLPGKGVSAVVDEVTVLAGNVKLLADNKIRRSAEIFAAAEQYLRQGSTVIYAVIDGSLAGFVVLSDTVRTKSVSIIDMIRKLDVRPALLTGDNENTAKSIANRLNINEIHANCLPEDKLDLIEEYQQKGDIVCMIGDGINDAPALKKANVGIAMGGIVSDIAVDAADIVLVDDKIEELPHLLKLSKHMMKVIKA